MLNSWFKRGTLRFNYDKTVSSRVRVGLASQLAYSSENDALVNTNGGAAGGVMYDALRFNPATPIRDSTGAYTYTTGPAPYVDLAGNPVAYALNTTNITNNFHSLLDAFMEWEILKGLKFKTLAGADVVYTTYSFYTPSYLYASTQNTSSGNAEKSSSVSYSWLTENTLSYDKDLNRNNRLSLVGGFSSCSTSSP